MIEIDKDILMQVFGVAGFAAYMTGYLLLQTGRICGQGNQFRWFNLIGSSLVLISLLHSFNLGAVLIQISWIVISLIGFARSSKFARGAALRPSVEAAR